MSNPDFHLTAANRQYLHQKIDQLDCSNGTWMVSIRPYKAKRSNPQNSMYWQFLTDFGKYLGYSQDEMHDLCRFKFLREAVEVGGQRMPKLKSTTKLNTKEFSEYFEACVQWASENGFIWEERMAA